MKTAVKLRVPYPDDADAGDALQAYSDFGTGTIDTGRPLLKAPAALFSGAVQRFEGHGGEVYGESTYGDGLAQPIAGGGHGDEIYGETAYGDAAAARELIVQVPPAFGMHKFSVQLLDAEGNPQGAALPEIEAMVSSTDPPSLSSFEFDSYDTGGDVLTFRFARDTE